MKQTNTYRSQLANAANVPLKAVRKHERGVNTFQILRAYKPDLDGLDKLGGVDLYKIDDYWYYITYDQFYNS